MNLHNIIFVFLMTPSIALAGPGAHGPNGEHLDEPASSHIQGNAAPRIETFTETYELVGRLETNELSIMIDRYDTNEPVLNGKLEVEFNGLKAPAKFHAEHGDYAVDDPNLLKALAKPGKHALLFTFSDGKESDLLEGTLDVGAHQDDHQHDHELERTAWIAGAVLALTLSAALIMRLRRRNQMNGKAS